MTAFFDDAIREVANLPKPDDAWLVAAAVIEAEAFRVIRLNAEDPDFPEDYGIRMTRVMEELGLHTEIGRRRAASMGNLSSLAKLHQLFHEVGTSGVSVRGMCPWSDKPDQNLFLLETIARGPSNE